MHVKTWLDRLTKESNLWLSANRMENEGLYIKAATAYLEDATESLTNGHLVKCALSCMCAASCIEKTGSIVYAFKLFSESAKLYMENADKKIANSIREALWSLKESYEIFLLVGDLENAKVAFTKHVAISKRLSPFQEKTGLQRDNVLLSANSKPMDFKDNSVEVKDIEFLKMFEKFFERRKINDITSNDDQKREISTYSISARIASDRGVKLNEKSIIS